jgi:hypothetical protein
LEETPGWSWDPNGDRWNDRWNTGLESLHHFTKREGHTRVPQSHKEGDFLLGKWVGRQQLAYKRNRLSVDQVDRLETVKNWRWLADM